MAHEEGGEVAAEGRAEVAERRAAGDSMGAALRTKVETVGAFAPQPVANEVEATSSNVGSRAQTHTEQEGEERTKSKNAISQTSHRTRLEMSFFNQLIVLQTKH